MAVTEALSLMYTWWADPIGRAIGHGGTTSSILFTGPFGLALFATHGIAPLGYAAFAFTLGTATGALIRRAVPAMAVTLAIFAAVQVAVPLWVRPHLLPPNRTVVSGPSFFQAAAMSVGTLTATTVPGQPGAWIVSSGAINASGQPVSTIPVACLPGSPVKGKPTSDLGACMASRGIREAITYQPAEPLLAPPVDRDRDLPVSRPGPGRVLLLAARPPTDLTCLATVKASSRPHVPPTTKIATAHPGTPGPA